MSRDLNGRQQQYEAEVARLEPMQAELDDWMLDVRGLHGQMTRALPCPRKARALRTILNLSRAHLCMHIQRRPCVCLPSW